MKRLLIPALLLFGACGSKDDKQATPETIAIGPLPLVNFEVGTLVFADGCGFQKEFVTWFVRQYASDLTISEGRCGEWNSSESPSEILGEFAGQCRFESCSSYHFTLVDKRGKAHKLESIMTANKGQRGGLLTESEGEELFLYSNSGSFALAEYQAIEAKAGSPTLPMLALTFYEALKTK